MNLKIGFLFFYLLIINNLQTDGVVLKLFILFFDFRMGIKEGVEWLVDIMERSKRTEMLRARAGVAGPGSA